MITNMGGEERAPSVAEVSPGDWSGDWCPDPGCDGRGCHLLHLTQEATR